MNGNAPLIFKKIVGKKMFKAMFQPGDFRSQNCETQQQTGDVS